jgi:alpha-mannosidase
MQFATRVRTRRVARLYSVLYGEIALSRKPFGIEHMYIHNFFLRITDTVTSQNIDLSSWDILYNKEFHRELGTPTLTKHPDSDVKSYSFIFCNLFKDVICISNYRVASNIITSELERIWNEVVVTYLR